MGKFKSLETITNKVYLHDRSRGDKACQKNVQKVKNIADRDGVSYNELSCKVDVGARKNVGHRVLQDPVSGKIYDPTLSGERKYKNCRVLKNK